MARVVSAVAVIRVTQYGRRRGQRKDTGHGRFPEKEKKEEQAPADREESEHRRMPKREVWTLLVSGIFKHTALLL